MPITLRQWLCEPRRLRSRRLFELFLRRRLAERRLADSEIDQAGGGHFAPRPDRAPVEHRPHAGVAPGLEIRISEFWMRRIEHNGIDAALDAPRRETLGLDRSCVEKWIFDG